MGLDMYLEKRVYVGAEYCDGNVEVSIKKEGKEIPVNERKVKYVTESAAYWRKANAIHRWFVENVQDGEDDCGEYYVCRESLKELLDLCKEVNDNPNLAYKLLPTQDGFFFGDTEYDKYYFESIGETISQLEDVLSSSSESDEFYYSSSW